MAPSLLALIPGRIAPSRDRSSSPVCELALADSTQILAGQSCTGPIAPGMSSNPFAKRGQLLCRWPAEPQKWSELQCRCIEFDPDHASTRLLGQIYVYSHATCICCQVTGLQLNVTQHPIRAPGHIPQSQSRRAVSRCRGRARFPQRINVRGEEPHLILINRHSRDLTALERGLPFNVLTQ
jgi:hypothetical protein